MAESTLGERLTDDEADRIFEQVMACEPALGQDDFDRVAGLVMQQDQVGMRWRLAAVAASKGGDFYREVAEDAEKGRTAALMVEELHHFISLLQGMKDLAECAAARLLVAGCNHPDFPNWQEEARASIAG